MKIVVVRKYRLIRRQHFLSRLQHLYFVLLADILELMYIKKNTVYLQAKYVVHRFAYTMFLNSLTLRLVTRNSV